MDYEQIKINVLPLEILLRIEHYIGEVYMNQKALDQCLMNFQRGTLDQDILLVLRMLQWPLEMV